MTGGERRGRRAYGSRTVLDVVRLVLGRGGSPEADLEALAAGELLRASAWRFITRWRQGKFVIDLGGQAPRIAWQAWPGSSGTQILVLEVVHAVRGFGPGERGWTLGDSFSVLEVRAADESELRFAVPTLDVPLVLAAFERASEGGPRRT